jgi:hypothetical protein
MPSGYTGELMRSCENVNYDFGNAYLVVVSGDGLNPCGHALLNVGAGGGTYFHVADLHDYPRYMDEGGFQRYLQDYNKRVLGIRFLHIQNPNAARYRMEEILAAKWRWLVIPHNCNTFVEEIVQAGGGTYELISNCPVRGATGADRISQ